MRQIAPSVVFDLDGTLIDSLPDLTAAVNRMLQAESRVPMRRDEVQSHVGDGAPALVAKVMAARGLDLSRHASLSADFIDDYTAHSCIETRPYAHVETALTALIAQGCRLGLCTNKPEAATHAVLAHLGLARFFDVIVAGDSLPERKPDPAPLKVAARALARETCLFVGDSAVDAATAAAAGIPFILFTEGYATSDQSALPHAARFDDFAHLPALVRQMIAPAF